MFGHSLEQPLALIVKIRSYFWKVDWSLITASVQGKNYLGQLVDDESSTLMPIQCYRDCIANLYNTILWRTSKE